MKTKWLEVACEVPEELSEAASLYLAESSGRGVCVENRAVDVFSESEIRLAPLVIIKSYFDPETDIELKIGEFRDFMLSITSTLPGFSFTHPDVNLICDEEWSDSWKAHFRPMKIGRRLMIAPTWEEIAPSDGQIVLRIDPGMAFGTGAHETTRLCLEFLERLMESFQKPGKPALLDLGTGSGILAIAAAKLGADHVLALDIDQDALDVAMENIVLNDCCASIRLGTTGIEKVEDEFDIILANILAEELARMAAPLSERAREGGYLVLSGILSEKEELVRDSFAGLSLEYLETLRDGEWIALLYGKKGVK